MREYRRSSWHTTLASVTGVHLITYTHDRHQYVGNIERCEVPSRLRREGHQMKTVTVFVSMAGCSARRGSR